MGQMISKPDTNPVLVALLNFFVLGAGGYFIMGQQKKAMYAAGFNIVAFFLTVCTLGLGSPLFLVNWLLTYDAYLLAQKLQSGQSIGENENAVDILNNIFKD